MQNLSGLYAAVEATRNAIENGSLELVEKVAWEMCETFKKDFPDASDVEYTPELCRLQAECLELLLEMHIMRGEPLNVSIRFGQLLDKIQMDMEHFPNWSDEDRKPAAMVAEKAIKSVEVFFTKKSQAEHKLYATRPDECKCLLCRKNMADKTGSHMVPHMLIAKVFSFDGSSNRDKVVVEVDNLSEGYKERYFGGQVYDDTVTELLGRSFSDEEVENEVKKTNALTRDYVFCADCEKRFGVIESYYADILDGKIRDYTPAIPYLFWISVMWRMSVGEMGTKLDCQHEKYLRKILNDCLAKNREDIVTRGNKKGYCAYSLYRASDTRDEKLGILGPPVPTIPYQALIGNLLINFFVNASVARRFCKQHDIPLEDLNYGSGAEKIGDLSFADFWMAKRQILDMNWEHNRSVWNLGKQSNQTLSKFDADSKEELERIQRIFGPDKSTDESQPISAWFNAENPNAIVLPKSICKIWDWIMKHKEEHDIDQMVKDLGYNEEELAVMFHWFIQYMDKKQQQDEQSKAIANVLRTFLRKELSKNSK